MLVCNRKKFSFRKSFKCTQIYEEADRQTYDRRLQMDGARTLKALDAETSLTKGCFNRTCSEERNNLDGMYITVYKSVAK
jgi:hypothetical protein